MNEFRTDNTEGYTEAELDALNTELAAIIEDEGIKYGSDEYYQRCKQFSDEVAGR